MTKEKCIHGYEDYEVLQFHFDNIISTSNGLTRPVMFKSRPCEAYYNIPITNDLLPYKSELQRQRLDSIEIAETLGAKNHLLAPGDSLYYTKQCKLPRTKYRYIWKNVPRPDKADAIVIPQFKSWSIKGSYMLFVNDQAKQVWMTSITTDCSIYSKQKKQGSVSVDVGNTVHEFCEDLSPGYEKRLYLIKDLSKISTLFDAKCVFIGELFAISYSQIPLWYALSGKYDKVVFEDILLQSLPKDTASEFTPETVENLYYQLKDNNPDTVLGALKVLACMPYSNCKATVQLLLDMTAPKWWKYKQATKAIALMCKELHVDGTYKKFLQHRYLAYSVDESDADAFIRLFKIRAKERIKEIVKECNHITNIHTEIDANIKMSFS